MVRPGRLDKLLYVDLPGGDERAEIVGTMTRQLPLGLLSNESNLDQRKRECERENVKLQLMELVKSERCDGYSGADLAALVREAGVIALKRALGTLSTMDNDNADSSGMVGGGGGGEDEDEVVVCLEDFVGALEKVPPSVSMVQRRKYEMLRSKFSGLPVRSGKGDLKEDVV